MKKIFTALTVALIVTFTANLCAAMDYYSVPVTHLKSIIGNWYDTNGNLVLNISNNYTINGYSIVSVGYTGDTVAFYKVRITDGSSYGDVYLQTMGSYDGYHSMLVLNEQFALRNSQSPRYVESVGGIYLGMDKNQVAALYGQPSSISNQHNYTTWKYINEGFHVTFNYDVVSEITIYKYGNRRFDRSGLSAKSSRADFEYKYNSSVSRRGNINIGHGELIAIGNDGVSLRCFTSGYVF